MATLFLRSDVAVYMWSLESAFPWASMICNGDTFTCKCTYMALFIGRNNIQSMPLIAIDAIRVQSDVFLG